MEDNCPQCCKVIQLPTSRLVQDSCGHKKCRICLLQDESDCPMCLQEIITKTNIIQEENVKYDNNRTAVITCNKLNITTNNDLYTPKVDNDASTLICKGKNSSVKTVKQIGVKKRSYKPITLPSHIIVLSESPIFYKCNICKKSFRTKSHIKYHTYCAEGHKPLRCQECNKEFISKYHLETHLLGHANKKQFSCDICAKSFTRYGKLNRHKLIHSKSTQYICQQCGKMFRNKDYLQRHAIIHTTEKPFHCNICNAKFNNRSNLNKHRITHLDEQLHMCDECGKRFKFKGALTVHRRSHSRLRPHVCLSCSKTFINAKELNRHQLVHSDTKNFSCSLCEISFRRKDNLQRHMRNTHPGKKGALIKKPMKRARIKRSPPEIPAENPNAINVIKAPSSIPAVTTAQPILSKPVPVINAPLKLAFKTTAFKSHYNIHSREYVEQSRIHPKTYDYEESVSICQKILSPGCSEPPRTIIKTLGKVSEKDSTEICQKILSPMIPPVTNDTFFEKSHSIRNIKFKLPSKYIHLSKKNIFNDITRIKAEENSINLNTNSCSNLEKTYSELKPIPPTNCATSVIVNSNSTNQNEMHWRRRALQNLELQSKQSAV